MSRRTSMGLVLCVGLFSVSACKEPTQGTSSAPQSSMSVQERIRWLQRQPAGMDSRPIIAQQLGEMGPAAKEAIPALRKLTSDKDPKFRQAATEALSKIEGK